MGEHDLTGHPLGRKVCQLLLRFLMKLLLRIEVNGLENIPPSGPAVVVINHIAVLDPVVVCVIFSRRIDALAKQEAFTWPIIGPLLKIYGTIPLHRGEADVTAVKTALRILRAGGMILVAPEGTRSPTQELQTGKEGAVMLALRGKAPIIPIGVIGTERLKQYWTKFRRVPIYLSVGQPFYVAPLFPSRRASRTEMASLTQETMYRLAAELPLTYRGVYRDPTEDIVSINNQPHSNGIQT